MNSGIYLIKNMVNGKGYVGSTTDFGDREKTHFTKLKCNQHHNCYLQSSYNKHGKYNQYGKNNFEFYILAYCSPENLLDKEDFYINYLKTMDRKFGYNLVLAKRHIFSQETKDKISKALMGRKVSKESMEKRKKNYIEYGHPMEGHKHTLESKIKNRESHLGKKASEETKLKMSISQKGKHNNPVSEETKLKISKTLKGRKMPENTRIKIAGANIGRKMSEYTRTQLLKSNIGRKQTVESKLKMKEAWRLRKLKTNSNLPLSD